MGKERRQIMELAYMKSGDYLIPNLKANEGPEEPLTKYGIMRRDFLKEHREAEYTAMLFEGTLMEHLIKVQEQAWDRLDFLMGQMAESEGVDGALKTADQMSWVRKMNSIKARAEETVLSELVYS